MLTVHEAREEHEVAEAANLAGHEAWTGEVLSRLVENDLLEAAVKAGGTIRQSREFGLYRGVKRDSGALKG